LPAEEKSSVREFMLYRNVQNIIEGLIMEDGNYQQEQAKILKAFVLTMGLPVDHVY
jgi:hypothetical protein